MELRQLTTRMKAKVHLRISAEARNERAELVFTKLAIAVGESHLISVTSTGYSKTNANLLSEWSEASSSTIWRHSRRATRSPDLTHLPPRSVSKAANCGRSPRALLDSHQLPQLSLAGPGKPSDHSFIRSSNP